MSTPVLYEASHPFDIAWVREQFPSLQLQVNGQPAAFLDGPAGTQVPRQVMDAVQKYFLEGNANTYGAFLTSRRTNEIISNARFAMADLFNSAPDEVVFGQNMTTITLGLSRAIGRELKPGDEILLTTLDHDANFSPWAALA
jgi:selenocysteine lyase/cysteine desulfurase